MHRHAVLAARRLSAYAFLTLFVFGLKPSTLLAQDEDGESDYAAEEPSFSINGMMRLQAGVFAPLFSEKFEAQKNEGVRANGLACDVREASTGCKPINHGQTPGNPSIARATLQIEAQWDINQMIGLHAIVRGVRSLSLPSDEFARVPQQDYASWKEGDYEQMGKNHRQTVVDNYYNEVDLREFYLDLVPNQYLSMRIGRQQVMWGDIGGYRLLDSVNPENSVWHFGPLEAVEDIRIPLWMWLTTIDMPAIEHSLELLWIPMIDRRRDTVSVPASFVGAWGVPYPNVPTAFYSPNLNFKYPGRRPEDMRGGARWKGNIGPQTNYSLVYLYTHQLSPPIPDYGSYDPTDSSVTSEIVLDFPRNHLAGLSLEHAIGGAVATVVRVEAAVEPNRVFAGRTDLPDFAPDGSLLFFRKTLPAINYAIVLQRPTMIRFLNPTQNFLLVAQFFHSVLPTLDMSSPDGRKLTNVPGFNGWQLQKHSYRVVGVARTSYLHGLITLGLTGMFIPNVYSEGKHSGFYSIDVGFRIGPHYRLNLIVADFIGKDPYRDLGLYRDRDEIAANFTVLF